jgi:hypothetical protein
VGVGELPEENAEASEGEIGTTPAIEIDDQIRSF